MTVPSGLFDLSGSVGLVTGSSQGLGSVIARGLARAGASVVLNGRDAAKLDRAVGQLTAEGLSADGFAFDVTNSAHVNRAVRQIEQRHGAISVLVNNAGIQRRGLLAELPDEAWREVIETNLTGPFLVARAVVGGMIRRQAGKIINVCSLMSELGRETTGPYAAAKGGLRMLTRAMTVEWARHNIQVNAIAPGYFLTDMTKPLADDATFDQWVKARTPARRWGRPEELVGAAVFLASGASDFVSGQTIYVDGGILASL